MQYGAAGLVIIMFSVCRQSPDGRNVTHAASSRQMRASNDNSGRMSILPLLHDLTCSDCGQAFFT
jgi:hypothetical protein